MLRFFLLVAVFLPPGFSYASDIYVDVNNGSDSYPGTREQPFKTIAVAQKAVQSLISKGLDENVTVYILPGQYKLQEPLRFDQKDSGTNVHSVRYMAYGNEKPLIHGGMEIAGFEPAGNNLWQAAIPQVKAGKVWFRSLFKDGIRQTRSRWPNEKCITLKSVSEDWKSFEFKEPLPDNYKGQATSELIMIQNWSTSRSLVDGLENGVLKTHTAHGRQQHPWTSASIGKHAWLEHSKTFVDTPGEWYLEKETGVLTCMSAEGENPNESQFIVPLLEKLVIVEGSRENPVVNLHFENLKFAHSAWLLPEIGFLGIQGGYYGYEPRDEPKVPAMVPPAAIEFKYTENCGIKDCRIYGTGASGVGIGAGCTENRIIGCRLYDIGITGISIGHRTKPLDQLDADWDDPKQVPVNNFVENNYLTNCGSVYYDGVGIFTAFTDGTRIRHNLLHDLPYVGISVGYKWISLPTSMKNCIVEYNRVYNVIQRVSDAGGIYTLGLQPGTRIQGNVVYNIGKWEYATPTLHDWANNAFFFDAGSKGFTVSENVVFNAGPRPVRFNTNASIGGSANAKEGISWYNNFLDTDIEDPAFPWAIAARAGLTPAYKHLIIEN